jgi:DNA-directed RNA polymerase specialized sigma24 family protein
MFDWLFRKRAEKIEDETKKGFSAVKEDINLIGKWVKHLNNEDKQLFEAITDIKSELSTIKREIEFLREEGSIRKEAVLEEQLFKKKAVYDKQPAVLGVENTVQTAVQTGDFYQILKSLSANERLLIFTILNSEMKLSYEDLALLLGKERATVRGQVNTIKQKCEGLLDELIEKNGKKRVFIPQEIREKLSKYAKVRVKTKKKAEENDKNEEKSDS